MTSLLNFIKIYQPVQKLMGGTVRQDDDLIRLRLPFRRKFMLKIRTRRLKVKIHILFYGGNSWTLPLRQMKSGAIKDHGKSVLTSFILTVILFDEACKYDDAATFSGYVKINVEKLCRIL
jgi:hypothetical protein